MKDEGKPEAYAKAFSELAKSEFCSEIDEDLCALCI
jgi:hypothetical protein